MKPTRVLLTAAGAALAAGTLTAPAAHAATTVPCSPTALIDAVNDANANGGDTLILATGCTYTLTAADNDENGLPVITTPISIVGNNATIARSAAATDQFRIFEVGNDGRLSLQRLTIRGGDTTGNGGGILTSAGGDLRLITGVTVTDNTADGDGGGAFIAQNAASTILNSALNDNNAGNEGGGFSNEGNSTLDTIALNDNHAGSYGGGLDSDAGTLTATRTTVRNNETEDGSAVDSDGGTITLNSSTITGNTATEEDALGAGIYNDSDSLTLNSTTVSNNTANGDDTEGAGIINFSPLTLRSSVVSGNTIAGADGYGGGIYNEDELSLISSRVSGNRITGANGQAGGIYNDDGDLSLTNSRVTGNSSTIAPGGLFTDTPITFISSAITSNTPTNCAGSPVIPPGCNN
ncbi:hypothetical protein [Streptomyces sp. WMMB 322]|uniref:hypothetical protein n=1 Tax=Streptomyces sp. WMMB 322 TaxID=1286821 RepID=UPI0006E348AC|nr:hypothetical protein [Streptomyces sp. WMMB 322]SCK16546.1 hypothetical protein H180DRAFT_01135 [Streptomyces sp. WMMB 322]